MNINENFDFSFNKIFSNENDDDNKQKNDRRFFKHYFDFNIKYQ